MSTARGAPGVLWMLVPAAAAAVGAAFWLRTPDVPRTVRTPWVSDPDAPIEALGGRLEGNGGTALSARLAPLHADAGRQAFETRALAERLGLGEGEPWRLSLRWEAGALSGLDTVLHFGGVQVVDDSGVALAPIPSAVPDASPDPLRALFASPAGTLEPGEQIDWILWGRQPAAGAHLAGLLPAGSQSEQLARRTGLSGRLDLAARTVRRSELVLPVARLDRTPPGQEADRSAGADSLESGKPDPDPSSEAVGED